MTTKRRQWTEERRKAQAERCRRNKPWKNATGPKTKAGKARASMNAYKHGGDPRYRALVKALLLHNKGFVNAYVQMAENKLINAQLKQMLIRFKTANATKRTETHPRTPPLAKRSGLD